MTLLSEATAPAAAVDDFDTGPLSWVIGEIRETLTRSATALAAAVGREDDTDARNALLRQARTHLHQAHGALLIVDVDGVAVVTGTIEDLLDRLESGTTGLTSDTVQAIDAACGALVEYLEELLAGAMQQPVRLYPYYRALMMARGAERIHPADLFFPDLALRPRLPELAEREFAAAGSAPPDYMALRKRFEKGLLPFLKGGAAVDGQDQGAAAMSAAIGEIEQAQANQQSRAFWWVMRAFAEAVAAGQIAGDVYVKQLFARINLQIRRMSEGSNSLTEGLLRDALFVIARVEQPSTGLQQVRRLYRLEGQVPADFEQKRYGQVDAASLVAGRTRLAHAKALWDRIAGGDYSVAGAFENEMRSLSEVGAGLAPPLAKLLRELNGIARAAASARPGDRLGMEMATSLLFVEHALAQSGHLAADFAERADAMTARLLSIVAGESISAATPWLDDMSRQAQQRQTIAALTGELQSSLRQVEKTLEDYFARPGDSGILAPVISMLHQVGGALAVLDQEDAVRAIAHTQDALRSLADAATPPDPVTAAPVFQKIARNIGALGFFVETLQLHGENRKKRFSFDDATGMFEASLVERDPVMPTEPVLAAIPEILPPAARESGPVEGVPGAAPAVADPRFSGSPQILMPAVPDVPDAPDIAEAPEAPEATSVDAIAVEPVADLPTVEEDLSAHRQEAETIARALCEAPADAGLQARLRHVLLRVKRDASLIDHPVAGERAGTALGLLDTPDFAVTPDAQAALLAATTLSVLPAAAGDPAAPVAVPDTDDAIDAELLEIFLTEAVEVLEAVRATLPAARAEPQEQAHLTTLRRSFHTLKGSGRMVGLTAFGEAAWSIEQAMNLRLSESRGGDADLFALLDMAEETLGRWVEELQCEGRSDRSPAPLIAAAERLKAGLPFQDMQAAPAPSHDPLPETAEPVEPSEPVETTEDAMTFGEPEELQFSEADMQHFGQADESGIVTSDNFLSDTPDNLPAGMPSETELPAEADPAFEAGPETESESPLLAATASVIDFPTLQAPDRPRNDDMKQIGTLEIGVPLYNIYLAETDELVRLLSHDFDEWRHEPEREVNVVAVHSAHSLAGTSATVGFRPLQEIAHALEATLQQLARTPVRLLDAERDRLDQVLERIRFMLRLFSLGEMADHEPHQVEVLQALQRALAARVETAPFASEPADTVGEAHVAETEPDTEADADAGTDADTEFDGSLGMHSDAATMPAQEAVPQAISQAPQIADELDPDLMPVFAEEASDMLPQMGQLLRAWQQAPRDASAPQSLLRLLHTVKGSARMAGAMRLGQHMHEMESRIEQVMHLSQLSPQMFDDLLSRHDHGLQMFDALQNPAAAANATAAGALVMATPEASSPVPDALDGHVGTSTAEQDAATFGPADRLLSGGLPDRRQRPRLSGETVHVAASPVPLVRVRADILDRLVNQAGEVSIARSRLENEVDSMRQSLAELTENVARLREQLREVEMQAESQIANQTSQRSNAPEGHFDPLEFDRFTRLQELTRMMAESVNDVGSVQQNLSRTLETAGEDLGLQARLTRELQQDLMSVRMVQFASITERLYRVTRQASKEVDKRVNLDIRGSAVEMDRSVLEKMAGPFEHLLRNAIVHGIETRPERNAAGKNEVGELLVEVRQEGNEVVIEFTDDGQGLNLGRIRGKATQTGLLGTDSVISDDELTDLIFHPGFSTASEVTELAGRGVGMDVVRAEATALGGRVAIVSSPGKGARFTIHLPVTLAVTQVVVLTTGGKTYAVPSVLVEQVLQLKTQALAAAYNEGAVTWQSQRVPMAYLSSLLGDNATTAVAQQYSPLVILKSGSNRIAIHVDEILGNREVVVKNIGPQLSRLSGIAGATVLGSGEIVLILNPVALAQHVTLDAARMPRPAGAGEGQPSGAVAEFGDGYAVQPVAGLRTQKIVMVVDDSLTVRRVTQRLLSREGYQVVLAKDGVDALEQLQSITPDVMLVDIEMPRMDGFDLTRNIRDDERTRHIPIIMITSRTASKHRNVAFDLGVNEYFGKPYQEEVLLASVAEFVRKGATVA